MSCSSGKLSKVTGFSISIMKLDGQIALLDTVQVIALNLTLVVDLESCFLSGDILCKAPSRSSFEVDYDDTHISSLSNLLGVYS